MKKTTAGLFISAMALTGLGVSLALLAPSEERAASSSGFDQHLKAAQDPAGHIQIQADQGQQGKALPDAILRVRELATYDDTKLWDIVMTSEVIADRGAAIDLLWERGQRENLTARAASEGDAFMKAKIKALSEMRG